VRGRKEGRKEGRKKGRKAGSKQGRKRVMKCFLAAIFTVFMRPNIVARQVSDLLNLLNCIIFYSRQ
jgi:hypothetical protein